MHICRRWRRIVFSSQRSLHLRLFCTPGTPVLETLSLWPALPIVVQYGGSLVSNPPVPEDEDNVMAALKQSNRVDSISLTVTKPLLKRLSAIRRTFSELENLVLLCGDDIPLTVSSKLSSAFRWGPRLRNLHLSRVAIPALPRLLFLSTALVDLQLHEISNVGYITPEAFASALSGMSHLQILSLHFLSSAPYPDFVRLPPPSERATLLSLRKLKYQGTSEYLDSLAARIDAPQLGNIGITFQPPPMERPQFGEFINRIGMQKYHRRADILFSQNTASISFTQPDSLTCLRLQVSCESFSLQLDVMTRICAGLYSFRCGIEHLRLCAAPANGYHYRWENLLNLFRGTKWAYVTPGILTDIIHALQHPGYPGMKEGESLLPVLHKLCIQNPNTTPSVQKAVLSFMHSRLLSGHVIAVEYDRLRTKEPHGTGTPLSQC